MSSKQERIQGKMNEISEAIGEACSAYADYIMSGGQAGYTDYVAASDKVMVAVYEAIKMAASSEADEKNEN